MSIRITRTLTENSAFAASLMEAAAEVMEAELHVLGALAVERTNELVSEELNYGSPNSGKRKPGRHLEGSFDYRIEGDEFPFVVEVYSKADPEKVEALEHGSPPHEIAAVRFPNLQFPHSQTGYRVRVPRVWHPGTQPGNFMRRGLNSAVERTLRRYRR